MKLSVIIVARDDNYGDDENHGIYNLNEKQGWLKPLGNIDRIKFCLENNLKYFEKYFEKSFEYLVVDWSPLNNNFLKNNHKLSNLFKNEALKDLIVKPETVNNMGLNPMGFYEYFGKNYGIKKSKGEYILITNSDDYFKEELVKEIKDEIENDNKKNYYRPYSRLDTNYKFEVVEEGLNFSEDDIFGKIGAPAAGDFILTHRDNIILKGQGFNEKSQVFFNPRYRQTSLDGDLIINMHINGVTPKKMKNSFHSFVHNKEERFYYHAPKYVSYNNDKYWGELRPSFERKIRVYLKTNIYSLRKFLLNIIKKIIGK